MLITDLPKIEHKQLNSFPQVSAKNRKSFYLRTEAEKVAQWKTIDKTRNRWIIAIERLVQKTFRDELKILKLSAKNSLTPSSLIDSVADDVRRNKDAWSDTIKNIFVPVGRDLAEDVVDGLKHTHPEEFKVLSPEAESFVDPFILDYLENQSATKVVGITNTTMNRLRAELGIGLDRGEGVAEIAKRIDTLYLESLIPKRSLAIARTEVIQASNLGSMAGAKATGLPGLKKVWLTTRDIRARDTHRSIDGTKEEIDAAFVLNSGSRLMFPADSSLGALAEDVINCRCTQFFEGEE